MAAHERAQLRQSRGEAHTQIHVLRAAATIRLLPPYVSQPTCLSISDTHCFPVLETEVSQTERSSVVD